MACSSRFYGLMDVAAGAKIKYIEGRSKKMLVDGWGEESTSPTYLFRRLESTGLEGFDDIELDFSPTETNASTDTIKVSRATFKSPLASEYIHEENKVGYVELVEPRDSSTVKGSVVLLAMTGDHGFSYRRQNYGMPLAREGYAVAILMIPYYGKRIPKGQNEHYIRTVYEYAYCGLGCFVEGAALINWMSKHFGEDLPVTVGGLSYGGVMAVAAGALVERNVIIVPCISGEGAGGIVSGLLNGVIKLPKGTTNKEREKIFKYMTTDLSVTNIVQGMSQREFAASKKILVHQVSAKNDWIMTRSESDALEELLKKYATTSSRTFVNGGHIFAIAKGRNLLLPEFFKAFEEYEAMISSQE